MVSLTKKTKMREKDSLLWSGVDFDEVVVAAVDDAVSEDESAGVDEILILPS
jgi:hypothetical protein